MANWFMLTLVGKDQPGIVANITRVLYEGGCSLGETSMIRLGGNFTMMMMVESAAGMEALRETVQPVADGMDLCLHLDVIEGHLHEHQIPDVRISVYGADRPGIVAGVTALLAQQSFNIVDLESDVGGTGAQPIYVLHIEGTSGQGGIAALRTALAPLGEKGGALEIQIHGIDTVII